jgi:transcriptional regulator with XRE-family HTH domain
MTNDRLPLNRLPKPASLPSPAHEERFSDDEMSEIKREFSKRLLEAFNDIPATIARRLKTNNATVMPYVKGERLPIAEMLIQIHRETGVSLNWLLLGKGRKYVEYEQVFKADELAEVEQRATESGRTALEEMRSLALAGLEAVKKYQG